LKTAGTSGRADLFRGYLKRGLGQAASPSKDQPVRRQRGR